MWQTSPRKPSGIPNCCVGCVAFRPYPKRKISRFAVFVARPTWSAGYQNWNWLRECRRFARWVLQGLFTRYITTSAKSGNLKFRST